MKRTTTKMSLGTVFIILSVVLTVTLATTLEQETCTVDRMMAEYNVNNADVLIAEILPYREMGSDGYGCGEVHDESVINYEATKWVINLLNNNNYVPGVKFGLMAYDSCYSAHHALSAASHFYSQYSTSSIYCNSTGKFNLGIVGPMASWSTKPVAGLTGQFPASTISMAATAPELSDKSKYPYFMRTSHSISAQFQAMMAAMNAIGWERIVIVYADNEYDKKSMEEFVRLSQYGDVCVVAAIATPSDSDVPGHVSSMSDMERYDVNGALYIGTQYSALLEAVDRIPAVAEVQWFLSYVSLSDPIYPAGMRGVMLAREEHIMVSEFYDYFSTSLDEDSPPPENPWYQDWFMRTFQCRLQGVNYPPYNSYSDCTSKNSAQKRAVLPAESFFIENTIKAVMTYARALKTAHTEKCGGVSGMCLGLRLVSPQEFHNYLQNVNFDLGELNVDSLRGVRVKYDVNGDFYSSKYTLWNYNNQGSSGFQWKEVGSFEDRNLVMNVSDVFMYNSDRTIPLGAIPAIPCPSKGCRNCMLPRPMVHYTYSPGDVVLTGLFDLHSQGPEVLSCGALKPSHALNAAAFRYAINTLKQRFPGILNGVDLGSLIVDLCDDGETGRLLLNNILSERRIISNIDPNLIKSVVGELDSNEAISMASMLQDYSMPYIESSATSLYLNDQDLFSTFSRAIPSDYQQMLAIVLMLKKMSWSYVQVVYTGDAYGKSGFDIIKAEGAKRSICVAASHQVGQYDTIASIVERLNEKPDARAVVAVVDGEHYRMMLEAIRDQNLAGKFVLIGTETWGQKMSIVDGYEPEAEGSLTIDLSSPQVSQFTQWLSTLNPTNEMVMKEMPFFAEWYQYAFSCYLNAGNRGMYTQECNPNLPITQAPRYEPSSYAPYMIYATYASARAIDHTLRDICGNAAGDYNGICWQFRSDKTVKHQILKYLKKSSFSLNGFDFKMVDGEGKSDYNLYSFSNGQYTRIATFNTDEAKLDMNFASPLSLPLNFKSECVTRCSECVYLIQTRPFIPIEEGEILLGANFALSNPGLDPFLCGELRLTNGIQLYGALAYAIQEVNNGRSPVSLNGVNLGALLMDHCNSAARAYGLPSALYSGVLGDKDRQPNLNAIRTWVTDNTLVTEEMKDFFSDFNLPVISPMSTSNMFLNEEEYPTYLRTIQGDSTIASAIAVLVKSLGLQYVSVVYSANSFGMDGVNSFQGIALQEGLCIIEMIEMGSDTTDNIIASLLDQPTHVVVTYLGLNDMDTFLEARGRNDDGDELLIISPEPYPLVFYQRGAAAKNLLALRMRTNNLDGFINFMDTLQPIIESGNFPEVGQYYMDLFRCNLPGEYKYSTDCGPLQKFSDSPNFYVDNYVLPLINAVYSFAAAARDTLNIQCGTNFTDVCAKFYSDPDTNTILLNRMREVSYIDPSGNQFHFTGKEGNTGREIVLFDGVQMKKVADFAGASLNILERNLRNMFESTKSSCNPPCTECINNNMNFTFIPGDIMLGGIFDVHEGALTPFSCGSINTLRGFQLLEAFHFAINKVNDKSGQFANVLKDIKLGGLGLDACQSAVKGGYLVSNLHSGLTVLERDGITVDPDSIEAYIGTYSSGNSIYLARLLKSLKIPQVSYGASSVALLDSDRYPYFLRTVPADDRQAMGMIDFMRRYDVRYVQVVHTSDNYGEQGAAIFNELAHKNKVCVAQTISFLPQSSVTVENANDVVLDLLKKPVANTIVIFAGTDYINELLKAIRRNPDAHGKFRFIGTETWANNIEAIQDVEDIAVSSVTVDLDIVDIREFDEYLATKTPANYPENPWFPEYYEEIQNCYLTIPDTRFPGRCSATPKNIVTSRRYKQDTALIHVINAVYSSAYGLDLALREDCGDDYTTVCEAFKNRENRRDFVLEKIQEASFVDLSGQPFSFSDRGDGNKGYVMYSIDSSNIQGYTYNPIAKYTSDGELIMTKATYTPSWDGSCERKDSCTECPTIRNLLTRYMLPDYLTSAIQQNPATLVYITDIHALGTDEYRCGKLNMRALMRALSIVYTLDQTNLIGSPFKIRPLILDNCNNALRIDQDLFNLLTTGKLCNAPFDSDGSIIDANSVMGVMTQGSRFVVAANRVTAPMKIQLMSSSASSTALSDQWRYPYFARTVPPDNKQMEVIAKILRANGWSYVAVLYSTESYGINGYRSIQTLINDGLYSCIGYSEGVNVAASVDEIRPVIRRVAETEGIGVIVLISAEPRPVLEAIKAEGLASRFVVIGGDVWADLQETTEGIAEDFAGAITVGFRNAYFDDFIDWMKNVRLNNKMGIPDDWFDEFYQNLHECYLENSPARSDDFTEPCKGFTSDANDQGDIVTSDKIKKFGPLLLTTAAAYALGSGLNEFHRTYSCADSSFAECMARIDNSRDILFNYTLRQTWDISRAEVSPRDKFSLELGSDRYWDVGYTIYSLMKDNTYTRIGSQSNSDGFVFNDDDSYSSRPGVVSRCPEGQYCDCVFDDGTSIAQTQPKYMRDHEPRNYFMYDEETGEQVYDWPIWAIAVAVLTCIGLLVGVILFFYFLIFYPVRGGTTILGFLMMIGLFGVYAINFAFFKPAAEDTCGVRQFLLGVVYAVVFAPLFVKAVDNWRFKDSEYSPQRYIGLTNPIALVLIALGIILVQCIIPIEWLILRPPSASLMEDSTYQHDWMWCDPHDFYDISMVLSMVFVVFLVILTAVFSALAWDSESNYYESRWIFVSCVCTAGCFLVWMVVSTNAGPPYRDPSIAIANFVNATALLIFIPVRKLVLLIQVSSEEEKAKTMPSDEVEANNELYSTVYTNGVYQPDVFQPESKPNSDAGY